MLTLILVLLLMVLLIASTVRWSIRVFRRRKQAAADDTKEDSRHVRQLPVRP
jgi:hypothetical protein